MKNNSKKLSVVSIVALSLVAIILVAVLAFYLLIVAGVSPKLQRTWITTAMTTMNHKYLATAFFSDEYIDKIMEENKVDDSGYNSEILTFDKDKTPGRDESDDPSAPAAPVVTVDPYLEEGYTFLEEGVYIKDVSGSSWKGKVMLISDPKRVKLVDTQYQYSCGEKVEAMAKRVGAVAAINGGGFADGANYDSNGGTPVGLIIEDGVLVCPRTPGDYYTYNMIGINSDGAMILRHVTSNWAINNDIQSSVSALCYLIVDGEGLISKNGGSWGIAPRTAIGQRKTGEFLFLTVDGRQIDWSIGCDLDVLESVLLEEGAYNAAMVDGGTSTVMVYQNEIINRPSNGEGRWINNCFAVMPICDDEADEANGEEIVADASVNEPAL